MGKATYTLMHLYDPCHFNEFSIQVEKVKPEKPKSYLFFCEYSESLKL